MRRGENYLRQIVQIFIGLHKSHPTLNLGKHLTTALDGHNLWDLSDKDFLLALQDYQTEMEMDGKHSEDEIDTILKEGMHLSSILEEEEEN